MNSLDGTGFDGVSSGFETSAVFEDQLWLVWCLPPSIQIIFELTQLDRVFEMIQAPLKGKKRIPKLTNAKGEAK